MNLVGGSRVMRIIKPFVRITTRNMSLSKKPILYGDEASPPVRFVMMTASTLNMDLEFHKIDLFKLENKTKFYTKINPLQKVPVLSINGQVICDSHAIALHMCRIKKDNELYPEDNVLRTKIDEMMYFNCGVLFPIDSAIFTEFFAGQATDEMKIKKWCSALDYLEFKLNGNKFLNGDKMRLSDLCCGTTVSSLETFVSMLDRHKRVKEWLDHLNTIPCFEINKRGLSRLDSFVKIFKQRVSK
ncbi:unnamed protein product [Arctia plantaginis]|uniref:Glutathione S-transferase n=1 Tax=Arctia plantaginis TaxID=874455 RepID=A0A8S0YLN3_ARCPL|nr:unnamed protein product [Arctia plantaginis]